MQSKKGNFLGNFSGSKIKQHTHFKTKCQALAILAVAFNPMALLPATSSSQFNGFYGIF